MKVGQMLSLHDGLLPPEVAEVLRTLQKEAPRVPPEVMRFEVEGALGDFDELFEESSRRRSPQRRSDRSTARGSSTAARSR